MPLVALGIGDDLGPAKVVLLREPRVGLEAVVVVDNVACGPAIGGVRMAPDVTVDEVSRLARAMTLTWAPTSAARPPRPRRPRGHAPPHPD
jgi:glutamate dehydrogenase (NAD(P)+)